MTRNQLYRLGEPFGDSCTCMEPGRRLICGGGGGKSKSTSATTTTSANIDKRQVVDNQSTGITNDTRTSTTLTKSSGNNVTVFNTDSGAVAQAVTTAAAALDANKTAIQAATDIQKAAQDRISADAATMLQVSRDLSAQSANVMKRNVDLTENLSKTAAGNYDLLLKTTLDLAGKSEAAFEKNVALASSINAAAAGMFGQNITLAGTLAGAGADFVTSVADQSESTQQSATVGLSDDVKSGLMVAAGLAALFLVTKAN